MSHQHISRIFHFVAFRMFYATNMCFQADETPCTVLYLIKGQKVDVRKAVITKPLELTFHGQPMPGAHFRDLVECEIGARGFASSSTARGRGERDPAADWKLQGLGAAMAEESSSSGAGREHTDNHTSTSMYGDHHPTYAITSSCSAGLKRRTT